jgi:hypothetical protein
MNRIRVLPLLLATLLAACQPADDQQPPEEAVSVAYMSFGEMVAEEGPALAPADLTADPHAYHGQTVRIEGTIRQVCQQAGCWITLDNPAGEPVRVHVPRDAAGDYAWTFPMDLGPRRAIIEGTARADTLSVDEQRHYAEDAGRPEGEIEAIDQEAFTASVLARGALVEQDAAPVPPAAGPEPATDEAPDVPVLDAPAGADAPQDGPASTGPEASTTSSY